MFLEFQMEGRKVLSRNIRTLATGITEMKREFGAIGTLLKEDTERNFQNQGSESGGKWQPLAPATIRARSERTGSYKRAPSGASATGPTLHWTRTMRDSFRSKPEKDQVTVDNPTEYFGDHQSEMRSNRRLPRRVMLEMKIASKARILSIIAAGINDRMPGGNYGRQY